MPRTPRTPLRYRLNPCDQERYGFLAVTGDLLAALYDRFTGATTCACCLGVRLVALALASAALAALAALALSR